MGQKETTMTVAKEERGGGTLRRMILALLVAALMAATMAASALPAMADTSGEQRGPGTQGPPSRTGDLNGQGQGSLVLHNENGACASHLGGNASGTLAGRGCL